MKNILFPTDFSPAANNAFIYALELANELEASITAIHAYKLPDIKGINMLYSVQEVYKTINVEKFQNHQDAIPVLRTLAEEHRLGYIPINHILRQGDTIPTILQAADAEQSDCIVMGTTGASGLKEIFVGSVAGEVMEQANCPVLAVPEKAKYDGVIDRIAITTTYTAEEKKALQKAIEFARNFEADVYCINVDTSNTQYYTHQMEKLQSEFSHWPHLHFEVLDGTDVFEEVTAYLKKNQIDILAMLSHKRSFFQELFNYSYVKKMAYHATTPILSFPAQVLV